MTLTSSTHPQWPPVSETDGPPALWWGHWLGLRTTDSPWEFFIIIFLTNGSILVLRSETFPIKKQGPYGNYFGFLGRSMYIQCGVKKAAIDNAQTSEVQYQFVYGRRQLAGWAQEPWFSDHCCRFASLILDGVFVSLDIIYFIIFMKMCSRVTILNYRPFGKMTRSYNTPVNQKTTSSVRQNFKEHTATEDKTFKGIITLGK